MPNDLFLNLTYDVTNNRFDVLTNIKENKIAHVVINFLRTQVGAGKDHTPPNVYSKYSISLELDLSEDTFTCLHNCGSKGLREGILLEYLKEL